MKGVTMEHVISQYLVDLGRAGPGVGMGGGEGPPQIWI